MNYDTLFQNATDIITKCHSYLITKCVRFFITKCEFYYKMRQLLQIATVLLQNPTVMTKCDVY